MDSNAARTIRWGDDDVPLLSRAWPAAQGVGGYRKTYALQPGESWRDALVSDGMYEHLVDLDGEVIPVGVAICRGLVADRTVDWAVMTEQFAGKLVLVDADAICVATSSPAGQLIDRLRAANGGRLGGLADVVGVRGDVIVLREAKVGQGRDRLSATQHELLRAQRREFGDLVDAAVVEWDAT